MRKIHDEMLAKSIIGFDVLPSAVHLTVSSLAGIFPKKTIKSTNIGTAMFGKKDGFYHLGSMDLILPEATLETKGTFIIGNREEVYADHGVRDESVDYVIMNPPFTSNTREGGKEGRAMFAPFDMDKETQKKMSNLEKKWFDGTCADGNAGYATNFIAVADKKLKHGGTMGMVLPSTISNGAAWEKCRELLRLRYDSITVVSIAGPSTTDGAFSFDTSMNELLVVARKESTEKIKILEEKLKKISTLEKNVSDCKNRLKKPKRRKKIPTSESELQKEITENNFKITKLKEELHKLGSDKRGKFVTIKERPKSILSAIETAKQIVRNASAIALENNKKGSIPILIGKKKIGGIMDCSLNFDWWFVGVYDAYLLQIGYELFVKGCRIPMTVLGGKFGPLSRDVADNKPNDNRAPFTISPPDGTAIYCGLSNNNSKDQKSIIVKPDCMAIPKPNAANVHVTEKSKTASHLHINILARYTSQCLLVLYSDKETLGTGASLPNYYMPKEHEKAFAIWGNSTLGIFCFWLNSGKQQFGRGISSKTSMEKMFVLDFSKLTNGQITKFDGLFDEYKKSELLPIKDMYKDDVRKKIDREILEILNFELDIDDLRERLCREPSISGGSKNATTKPFDSFQITDLDKFL